MVDVVCNDVMYVIFCCCYCLRLCNQNLKSQHNPKRAEEESMSGGNPVRVKQYGSVFCAPACTLSRAFVHARTKKARGSRHLCAIFDRNLNSSCAAGGLKSLTWQRPLCEVELCSLLCSRWCPLTRRHDWQPQLFELISTSDHSLSSMLLLATLTSTAATPQRVSLKMNGKRPVFTAAPHLTFFFYGQSGLLVELFVLLEANKL